jgi:hypothetical protein
MNTGLSSVANCGLTFVFDIRHPNWYVANCGLTFVFDIRYPNWYVATKIRALSVSTNIELDSGSQNHSQIEIEALLAMNQR